MTQHTHTTEHRNEHGKKMTTEKAVLISGIIISIAILAHGFIVAKYNTTKSGASGLVDKAVIAEIMKTPAIAHKYFADQTPTEEIVMTVYTDTECPFCKNFHSTLNELLSNNDGKLAVVYKHFPLSFHPNAQKEAESIECVREIESDAKAFKYMDAIFAVTPSNNKLTKEALFEITDAMKLKTKKIRECTESGKYAQKVKAEIAEGEQKGVQGTPFTFIEQNKEGVKTSLGTINGAQPIEAVQAILSQAK